MPIGTYKRTEKHLGKLSRIFSGENNSFYGRKHTEETKKKMSLAKIGKKLSKEHKKKLSESHKGNIYGFGKGHKPWNKGTKGVMKTNSGSFRKGQIALMKGRKKSKKVREEMSEITKKLWQTPEFRKKIVGRKNSEEAKKKMSKAHIGKNCGEKAGNWKGGITPENMKIRASIEIRLWREAVFARDNWICQKYGIKGGKLHAHHIKNFADYPELRTAIENGITFSDKAHKEFHKKYGYKNNTIEQIKEFLNN